MRIKLISILVFVSLLGYSQWTTETYLSPKNDNLGVRQNLTVGDSAAGTDKLRILNLSGGGTQNLIIDNNGVVGVGSVSSWLSITEQSTSTTGVAGNYYYYDVTADSDTLTLPGSPTADDLIGIYLETTSSSNTVLIARNGNTIAGLTSNVTLFIAADYLILQFINGDWSIVSNGIQRHCGSVSRDAAQSITNDVFFVTIAWDTEESDFGGILDIVNDRFIPRRASYYDISIEGDINLEGGVTYTTNLFKNGVAYKRADRFVGATTSNQSLHMEWSNLSLTTTDTITWRISQDGTAAQNTLTGTQKFRGTVCEK